MAARLKAVVLRVQGIIWTSTVRRQQLPAPSGAQAANPFPLTLTIRTNPLV